MARSYANIATAIWRDDEFRAMSLVEQHAYLLLTTQPDISAAGVLSLNLTRWSSRSKGCTTEELRAAIDGLERHRFVVVDYHTEELLVRSFVRWDNGYTNPKRRPVIRDASGEIESMTLRRVLALELERVGLPGIDWTGCLPDSQSDSQSDGHTDSLSAAESPDDHEPESSQVDSLSDSHADTVSPSERVVVTQGPYLRPQPTTHNPQPTTRIPPPSFAGGPREGARDEPPPDRCGEHLYDDDPPRCGRCADARKRAERYERDMLAADAAERARAAREHAEAVRAEIDACTTCDETGYTGGKLCHHTDNTERLKRGVTAAREQVGRAPKSRADTARPDLLTESSERRRAAEAKFRAEQETS